MDGEPCGAKAAATGKTFSLDLDKDFRLFERHFNPGQKLDPPPPARSGVLRFFNKVVQPLGSARFARVDRYVSTSRIVTKLRSLEVLVVKRRCTARAQTVHLQPNVEAARQVASVAKRHYVAA
jgi:hypothetical protein